MYLLNIIVCSKKPKISAWDKRRKSGRKKYSKNRITQQNDDSNNQDKGFNDQNLVGEANEECCILTSKGYLYRIEGFSQNQGIQFLAVRCKERNRGIEYSKFLIDFEQNDRNKNQLDSKNIPQSGNVSFSKGLHDLSSNRSIESNSRLNELLSRRIEDKPISQDSELIRKYPEFKNHILAGKIDINKSKI